MKGEEQRDWTANWKLFNHLTQSTEVWKLQPWEGLITSQAEWSQAAVTERAQGDTHTHMHTTLCVRMLLWNLQGFNMANYLPVKQILWCRGCSPSAKHLIKNIDFFWRCFTLKIRKWKPKGCIWINEESLLLVKTFLWARTKPTLLTQLPRDCDLSVDGKQVINPVTSGTKCTLCGRGGQ